MYNIIHKAYSLLLVVLDSVFPKDSIGQKSNDTIFNDTISIESLIDLRHSLCVDTSSGLQATYLFPYRDPTIKKIIWQLKYHGNKRIAKMLSSFLAEEIIEAASEQWMWHGLWYEESSLLIIPFPISTERRLERGWNQTELITHEMLPIIPLSIIHIHSDMLKKCKHTIPQTTLNKEQRMENLKGCFEVFDRNTVSQKIVILFDDVLTTGSTLREAAHTLHAAGASKTICLALAH